MKNLLGENPASLLSCDATGSSSYCERVTAYHQRCVQEANRQVDASGLHRAEKELQPVLAQLPKCRLQLRLSSVCQRAVEHWRFCLKGSDVCEDISTLDELTGELGLQDLC